MKEIEKILEVGFLAAKKACWSTLKGCTLICAAFLGIYMLVILAPLEREVDWFHQIGNLLSEGAQVHHLDCPNTHGGYTIRLCAWTKHTPAGDWQWASIISLRQLAQAGVKFDSFTRYDTSDGIFVFDGLVFRGLNSNPISATKFLIKKEPGVFLEHSNRQVLKDLPLPKL